MRKAFLQLCALIIFIFAFGFIFQTTQAIVETEWPAGKANVCKNSGDGFVSFEGGADEASISSTVPGMKFTTTGGLDWKYSDIRTGNYSVYPYGHQGYETNGNFFAWLGTTGGKGRIDFTEEEATYFSCLVSTASGLVLDAYDSDDTLVATSGWAESNVNTRTFTRLTVEAPGGIAYIIVHDTGNYWLIDDICTDISPEYELDVPYFNQCDDPWKELSYNHITGTICNWGCALTSSTMILNYYGEPYGLQTDPEKLNEWLNHRFWDLNGNGKLDPDEPTGYTRYGDINWKLVAEYFNDVYGEGVVSYNGRGDFNKNKETYITFRENSDSILNSDLSSQRPVILKAPYAPWHFVVATGKINIDNNSTWAINDPGWRSKENLLSYDNEYFGIRRYKPREEDNSAITIKAYSPVEIYTIDSQGRYLGKDPNAGEEFDEIPNGGYYTDTSMINGLKIKTIEVLKPIDGNYTIKVIGTDTGSYDIDYYSYDRSGYWSNFKTFTAEITSGEIHNYEVNYSSDIINRPPIANAEIQAEIQPKPLIEEPDDNYIIEANTFNGANITLDGTASYDPESASLTYSWSDEDENILGTDEVLDIFLSLDEHQITLTVSDGRLSSSDVLDITIQDTILPEVEIISPEEITYLNTQGLILIAYTINDICDSEPEAKIYLNEVEYTEDTIDPGKYLGETEHALKVGATDDSGNNGADSVIFKIIPEAMNFFSIKSMKIHWVFDHLAGKHLGNKTSFTISGSFELPDKYQEENLDKSALLYIKIADQLVKDKVNFKKVKNPWLYQEASGKKNNDLSQGADIKTMAIHWIIDKNSNSKRKDQNWFYIRGELSLPELDINALPQEAIITLEIPVAPYGQSGSLDGKEAIEFEKLNHIWSYRLSAKWDHWKDGWWKKID